VLDGGAVSWLQAAFTLPSRATARVQSFLPLTDGRELGNRLAGCLAARDGATDGCGLKYK
jgi:hypothetical protein